MSVHNFRNFNIPPKLCTVAIFCLFVGDVCLAALIKMGDLLSVSNATYQKDVAKAAEMYKLATLSGEPQVCPFCPTLTLPFFPSGTLSGLCFSFSTFAQCFCTMPLP